MLTTSIGLIFLKEQYWEMCLFRVNEQRIIKVVGVQLCLRLETAKSRMKAQTSFSLLAVKELTSCF